MSSAARDFFSSLLVVLEEREQSAWALTVAASEGFVYRTLVHARGDAVVVMERDADTEPPSLEYRVLGTNRLSTLSREIAAAERLDYEVMGISMDASRQFWFDETLAVMARPYLRLRHDAANPADPAP